MNNITILKNYLEDIADAIRYRGQTSDPIRATDFMKEIRNLPANIIYNVPTNEETGKPDEIIQVMNYYTPQYVSYQYYNGDKIDLSGLRTNNMETMANMFFNCPYVTKLDFSNFNTVKTNNMYRMFNGCRSLKELNLSSFNGANVTNISNMFHSCGNLRILNMANFNACNLNTLLFGAANHNGARDIFDGTQLVTIDWSGFNGCKINSLGTTFTSQSNLVTLNLSGFNGNSLQTLFQAFTGCTNLINLNMYNFNAHNVANMNQAFSGCNNLPDIKFLETEVSTHLVSDWHVCFSGCQNLKHFNYPGIDLNNAIDMAGVLRGCNNLTEVNFSYYNLSQVKNMNGAFSGCTNLSSIDLTGFKNHMFTDINLSYMFAQCSNLTSLKWDFNLAGVRNITSIFNNCQKYGGIIDFSNQDLGQCGINGLYNIVTNCINLTGLNFANANGSLIGSILPLWGSGMWDSNYDRRTLKPFNAEANSFINMSNFNGSNMANMYYAFGNCNVCHINLANFNGQRVNNMGSLCSGLIHLKTIDLSNFGATLNSSPEAATSLFSECKNLTSINMSNFGSIFNKTYQMFYNTHNLKELNINNVIFNNIYNADRMFSNCGLPTIDLSTINFVKNGANNCNLDRAFEGAAAQSINFGNQLPNMEINHMAYMFSNSGLISFNSSKFAKTKGSLGGVFYNCQNLVSVDLSDIQATNDLDYAFYNCINLEEINLGDIEYTNSNYYQYLSNAFINCHNLRTIKGTLRDFGNKSGRGYSSINLRSCNNLTQASVMNLLEGFVERDGANSNWGYIYLTNANERISATNLAKAEAKGWQIRD